MKKQQKQTDNKKKKKRTILLATLIPLGAAAVATAVAVPLVLMNKPGEESEEPTSEETLTANPLTQAGTEYMFSCPKALKKRVLYTINYTVTSENEETLIADEKSLKYFKIFQHSGNSTNVHFKVKSSGFTNWTMNDENTVFSAPDGSEIQTQGTYQIQFYITGAFTDDTHCEIYLTTSSY